METKVFNLIVLDESGSMNSIQRQALDGLNETLQTIRKSQENHANCEQLVSIVPFTSGDIRLLRDKQSIVNVQDLRSDEYNPGGGTPLYDAIGFGIESIRKSVGENDAVLVTIITDGEENASQEYSGRAISLIVNELKEKGWMFTYIGANQDALKVAESMSISNAMNFKEDAQGVKEMFMKELKCRERYFASAMCEDKPIEEVKEIRRQMAKTDNYFKDV